MADKDDIREGKDFGLGVPQQNKAFYIKGSGALDWGMQNRLARIFNPASGKTVMLAFDHGYFQGPTTGLERMDLSIVPLIPHADVLMCTRGALRTVIPASSTTAWSCAAPAARASSPSFALIAVDIEDCIRLNAAAITTQDLHRRRIRAPVDQEPAQLHRHRQPLRHPDHGRHRRRRGDEARRALFRPRHRRAELGAHYVKSYFIEEGFERVVAGCPVPIVIAGGKKLPEIDALTMAYKAIDQGAAGVDMGRNIFQSDDPVAMIQAVGAVVHKKEKPEKAFQLYQQLKARNVPDRSRLARSS
jgi:putative autoinducer-2 (AI-2) aldolase